MHVVELSVRSVSWPVALFLVFLLGLAMLGACGAPPETLEADYLLENVNVIPLDSDTVLQSRTVAIRDSSIVAIFDSSAEIEVVGAERLDGAGGYLIPGLADMHVHMRMDPQAMFNLFIANGVTTVRNMRLGDGEGAYDHVQLRADVTEGRRVGPRYLVSGPQITSEVLARVDHVEPLLDRHAAEGYDFVKIHGDLDPDVYDALLSGARRRQLPVVGHLQHQRPLSESLRMDGVEHLEEFLYTSIEGFGEAAKDFSSFLPTYQRHTERIADPDYRRALAIEVAAAGIHVDPTLIIYQMVSAWIDDNSFATLGRDSTLKYLPLATREQYLDPIANPYRDPDFPLTAEHMASNVENLSALLLDFHQAGVPLLLGTDSFGSLVPGFSIHKELELIVAAGISAYDALRIGTANVAAYLDEADSAGTIEVGKRADLVLLDGNPLTNIRNTRDVRGVYTQGKWYPAPQLNSMLKEAEALVSAP